MKSLFEGLVIIAVFVGGAYAASTDTVNFLTREIATEMTPVEHKVVEIHMATKAAPVREEKIKKRGKIATLPLAHGTCSGSFFDSEGDIITARHCVDGFDTFEVQTYDRRLYSAVVVATSTSHDLAIIHIDRRNTPFFHLAEGVTRGQKITILGSPLGITDTLSTGVVARLDGDLMLLDCGVLPGNSGGPVFDNDGNLVGVVNAGFIVLFGMTHLNMAQSLDAVYYFLSGYTETKYGLR